MYVCACGGGRQRNQWPHKKENDELKIFFKNKIVQICIRIGQLEG